MRNLDTANLLMKSVKGNFTTGDDPRFWQAALYVLADEFLQRYDREAKNDAWIFLIGTCSHWIRPHQARWTAAGGFAYPEGYQSLLPELDWSTILSCKGDSWTQLEKLPGKKPIIFRVAVPARSARHKQAAVHTKWSTSPVPVFYGFRNLRGSWKCVAASDERSQGGVIVPPEDMTHT